MPSFFARLTREDVTLNGWKLSCAGSATLATFTQAEDKGAVAVQNCESSIASALTEGLTIHTLAMTAMMVSGLKLTKAEKVFPTPVGVFSR